MKTNLISRRRFLATSALSAGSLSLTANPAHAAPAPASGRVEPRGFDGFDGVELAIATICTDGFGNEHHEPAFRVIPQLGFENVEFNLWYPDQITPGYIRSIKKKCEQTQLKPISLQGSGFGGEGRSGIIKDISHKLLFMQYCVDLGCHVVKFTGSRRGTQGGLQAVIDVCKELAPAAEEMGVVLTLENHAGNVLEQIADYEQIFAVIDSPNIGLCLDTGHFEGVGIQLSDVLDRFAHRTLHVDLKDCRAFGQGHDTVPFGQGVTDFDAFLDRLLGTGYRGYLVVEQAWSEPKGNWQEDLAAAYQRFSNWQR